MEWTKDLSRKKDVEYMCVPSQATSTVTRAGRTSASASPL